MEKKFLEVSVFWMPIVKEIFYQGKAEIVSSENSLGNFDILPKHANFITLIFNNLSIFTFDKKKLTYQFKRGILEVTKDKVNVFLGF